jgi:hypothetical protein
MSLMRLFVLALAVLLPLTALLAFAGAGQVVAPHPWSKHTHSSSHAAVRLPSGIATTPTALVALPLVGRLAVTMSLPTASIALQPPFVPPRA